MRGKSIKTWIKKIIGRLPYVKRPAQSMTQVRHDNQAYPPGHFYSPIPSREEILKREVELFDNPQTGLEGIDLNEEQQLDLLRCLCIYYEEFPYLDKTNTGLRYYLDNNYYFDSDALFLYSMMRKFKPNRIIEIGSGFSSALMLDTRDYFLEKNTALYFIDPHPTRLLSVLKESDKESIEMITTSVQDVNMEIFQQLTENDFLFVDSSHVAKIGSDVNFILFEILPKLKKGVLVHVHDIFYPFIYPKEWVLKGRAWNEVFMLRAFLQYNTTFKIILFNTFLEKYHADWFNTNMPLCLTQRSEWFSKCGSIWLRKQM
jgi:predicted O-methyltransferase YrrM